MAHFWFSEKMYEHRKDLEVLIDDVWTPFTVQSQTKDHGCKHTDLVYLGETDTRNVKIGGIDQRQFQKRGK